MMFIVTSLRTVTTSLHPPEYVICIVEPSIFHRLTAGLEVGEVEDGNVSSHFKAEQLGSPDSPRGLCGERGPGTRIQDPPPA